MTANSQKLLHPRPILAINCGTKTDHASRLITCTSIAPTSKLHTTPPPRPSQRLSYSLPFLAVSGTTVLPRRQKYKASTNSKRTAQEHDQYRLDSLPQYLKMTTKALIPLLVSMMLLTGVCNTLLTKYQVRSPFSLHTPSMLQPNVLTKCFLPNRTTSASATAPRPPNAAANSSSNPFSKPSRCSLAKWAAG